MEQKVAFICEWNSGKYTITELCKAFGISRPTGYRLISRYEKHGIQGLLEQSNKPINHSNRTKAEVEEKILSLKKKHDKWGAKKLHTLLFKYFAEKDIPSIITVQNLLSRHGLVCPQKLLRRVKPVHPIFAPKRKNILPPLFCTFM
ncbi:helix-turn-helix domain-containing protein [Carboxylicivirga taeanensis]|uniref:helix-turn-helix domain-containing protein n=1 Tax=Carboxylicivirga taeanensis TaxID=1416875 RepID=UPI003F6E2D9E